MKSFLRTHSKLLILAFLSSLVIGSQALEECHALVLDGDGDAGWYQAGAIAALLKTSKNSITWDVISGVGIGSFNAAGLAQF